MVLSATSECSIKRTSDWLSRLRLREALEDPQRIQELKPIVKWSVGSKSENLSAKLSGRLFVICTTATSKCTMLGKCLKCWPYAL